MSGADDVLAGLPGIVRFAWIVARQWPRPPGARANSSRIPILFERTTAYRNGFLQHTGTEAVFTCTAGAGRGWHESGWRFLLKECVAMRIISRVCHVGIVNLWRRLSSMPTRLPWTDWCRNLVEVPSRRSVPPVWSNPVGDARRSVRRHSLSTGRRAFLAIKARALRRSQRTQRSPGPGSDRGPSV